MPFACHGMPCYHAAPHAGTRPNVARAARPRTPPHAGSARLSRAAPAPLEDEPFLLTKNVGFLPSPRPRRRRLARREPARALLTCAASLHRKHVRFFEEDLEVALGDLLLGVLLFKWPGIQAALPAPRSAPSGRPWCPRAKGVVPLQPSMRSSQLALAVSCRTARARRENCCRKNRRLTLHALDRSARPCATLNFSRQAPHREGASTGRLPWWWLRRRISPYFPLRRCTLAVGVVCIRATRTSVRVVR